MVCAVQHTNCMGDSKPRELETSTELKFGGKFTHAKCEVIAVVMLIIQFIWNAIPPYCLALEGSVDFLRIAHRHIDESEKARILICHPFLLGNQVAQFACFLKAVISFSLHLK